MKRRMSFLRSLIFGAVCLLAPMGVAHADAFEDCIVADDAELAAARGGYITAGGVKFDLGAVITTWRNGAVALQTMLTWTPSGATATHVVGAPNANDIAAGQPVPSAGGGIALIDPKGATTIIHMGAGGPISNAIITADSNQTFAQDIAVTITLPGFDALQSGIQNDLMGIRLGADLGDLLSAGVR